MGYLWAMLIGALIVMGWSAPALLRLLVDIPQIIPLALMLMVVLSIVPVLIFWVLANFLSLFNPLMAVAAGAATGAIVFWRIDAEGLTQRPMTMDWVDLTVYLAAGATAGCVWYWIEKIGREENETR